MPRLTGHRPAVLSAPLDTVPGSATAEAGNDAVAATERMRGLLRDLVRESGLSQLAVGRAVGGGCEAVDMHRLLTGGRALEVGHLLAALDVLGMHPRLFFGLVWSEPAAPSPLLERLLRRREEPARPAPPPAAGGRKPRHATPAEATMHMRRLLGSLVAARGINRTELQRRLLARGVPVAVGPVLAGVQRLRVLDLVAMLGVLELHPLELVRMVWPPAARQATPAGGRRRRDDADGNPAGLLRHVD